MENEEMTNDAAVAWMRKHIFYRGVDGRTEGERVVSERKVYENDDPLYSATTVAELRAEVDRLQALSAAISRDCNECANQRNEANAKAAAAERRVAECESVLALVLGGMLSGAVKCKPLMTKRDGDYVVGSLQELIENTLRQEKPE